MRMWTIEGADKQTGKERVITIEALTHDEAVMEAGAAGLLVSAVHELPPALRPRAGLANPPEQNGTPNYKNITRGVGTLGIVASILFALGWVCVAVGTFCALIGIVQIGEGSSQAMPIAAGIGTLVNGIVMVVASVLISMFSALALAVRDIAVNSFK